jgi:hypothetical protein
MSENPLLTVSGNSWSMDNHFATTLIYSRWCELLCKDFDTFTRTKYYFVDQSYLQSNLMELAAASPICSSERTEMPYV